MTTGIRQTQVWILAPQFAIALNCRQVTYLFQPLFSSVPHGVNVRTKYSSNMYEIRAQWWWQQWLQISWSGYCMTFSCILPGKCDWKTISFFPRVDWAVWLPRPILSSHSMCVAARMHMGLNWVSFWDGGKLLFHSGYILLGNMRMKNSRKEPAPNAVKLWE